MSRIIRHATIIASRKGSVQIGCSKLALLFAIGFIVSPLVSVHVASAVVISGPALIDDIGLLVDFPNDSIGAAINSDVGIGSSSSGAYARRSLIRFDLSSETGTVDSATMRLTIDTLFGPGTIPNGTVYSLYNVTAANAGWIEGANVGLADADAGFSTWNHLVNPGTPWAGSAGLSTSGTDYDATPIGTLTYATGDTAGTFYDIALTPSAVQNWIDNPSQNGGVLLRGPTLSINNLIRFASVDHGTAGLRPYLTIEYAAPVIDNTPQVPEPSSVMLLALGTFFTARHTRREWEKKRGRN